MRELKNVITRASLLSTGAVITVADLGLPAAPPLSADTEPEREDIVQALTRAKHNVAQAAAELGLSRQALYRRMERLGIGRSA